MQHAPKETLPSLQPGGRTAGVDWARDDHAVAIVDAGGGIQERFTVPHVFKEPTVMAHGELPGDMMPPRTGDPLSATPSFPAAATTTMPA